MEASRHQVSDDLRFFEPFVRGRSLKTSYDDSCVPERAGSANYLRNRLHDDVGEDTEIELNLSFIDAVQRNHRCTT